MKRPDFENLRDGNADCPSDLTLDRLVAGELEGAAHREAQDHVDSCAVCEARVSRRQAGFDALDDVDPRALLAGIRRRLDEEPSPARRRGAWARWLADWRRSWAPLAAVGAAAALLVVLLPRETAVGPGLDSPDGGVRRKGDAVLHVHRMTAGTSEEVLSGGPFHAGDRIRFVIDLPEAGHVTVVGVEADGDLYVAWPLGGNGAHTLRPRGARQALPGAVSLDATPGREMLYLIHCPPSVGRPSCTTRGAGAEPACPDGCALSPFVLEKQP